MGWHAALSCWPVGQAGDPAMHALWCSAVGAGKLESWWLGLWWASGVGNKPDESDRMASPLFIARLSELQAWPRINRKTRHLGWMWSVQPRMH